MSSFEAAFGKGAKNIAEGFVESSARARTATTSILTRMNEWASAGWSAIPHKRAIGIGSAVGVGLAVALSSPPPSLGAQGGFIQPDLNSGSGGQNHDIQNVHPSAPPVGEPSGPDMSSSANRAHISPNFRVRIGARAMSGVDAQRVGSDIRNALGGRARINTRVSDDRQSLTSQRVADILGRG
jgi:hypothetical protein